MAGLANVFMCISRLMIAGAFWAPAYFYFQRLSRGAFILETTNCPRAKEIFCSKECYQAHEGQDWEYSDGGKFRASRRAETFIREEAVSMWLCEELIEGRWEPFYAVKQIEFKRA